MKIINQCAAFGLALTMLSSCSQDAPWSVNSGEGALRIKVEAVSNVEAAVPAVRAITTDVVTPPASQFEISMVKEGGGYEQTWSSIAEFEKETTFPVGNYILSAYYGDDSSQGTVASADLGYEYAQYYGETQVTIRENETTEVQLTVGLTNAIVVIEYTEAFKNYFKSYHTILYTAGEGDPLDIGSNEAMNYVQPGELGITIAAVQQNDKELTLSPGKFDIEANHMYKLRYNVYNGEIGDAVLAIEFDDSLNVEPITINLSEELEATRAPQVTTIGFEPSVDLVTLSGTPYLGDAKFSVVADGGIASAVLTINSKSDTFKPSYLTNGTIDLCSAFAAENRAAMEADGIKIIGLQDENSKMGELDLSGLFSKLAEDTHTFTLLVSDTYRQSNEPVTCTLTCLPTDMGVEGLDAMYGEGYADLRVRYNGPHPALHGNPFSFSVKTSTGEETCEIKTIKLESESTRADFPAEYYIYRVGLPFIETDSFDVNVFFNGTVAPCGPATVNFNFPNYNENMEYDAMATQLRFRTNFTDPYKKKLIEDRMRVFIGGEEKEATFDKNINAYVIEGLTPDQDYAVKTTLQAADNPTDFGSQTSLKMEEALPVPNGDFSQTHETIHEKLQVGGKWQGWGHYTTTCLMQYSEPSGDWASINSKTFYLGSTSKNTWFMVASTFMQSDGEVLIRSVAYDHAGIEPKESGGAFSVTSYCTNYPDRIANRVAGELFLGNYSFDGTDHRNEGIDFGARPSKFVFNYKYQPYKSDSGLVEVKIISSDGTVISSISKELEESNEMKEIAVDMPLYEFGSKPSILCINFVSSTHVPVLTRENSEIDLSADSKAAGGDISTNSAHALSTGSELTVSNLRFNY